jgi:uncharacterized membrane protein YedE/YeeE
MNNPLVRGLTYLLAGLLFAVGLGLAGMTQPSKVVGFLDVTGEWDPSLAFVMVGGILTHMVLYRLITKRPSPVMAAAFQIPTRRDITPRLVVGSGLFGVGWAIAGYCPGPGLVSSGAGSTNALLFLGAMVGGMVLYKVVNPALTKAFAPRKVEQAAPAPSPEHATVP